MKRSVLLSLILMGVSNASFALLAMAGHSQPRPRRRAWRSRISPAASAASVVVAYFSALTDLRFTASQYALISAAASIVGRLLTGTTAGAMVEAIGFVNFYWLTTVAALPGIVLFWWMMPRRPDRRLDRHRRQGRRGRRAGGALSPAADRSP